MILEEDDLEKPDSNKDIKDEKDYLSVELARTKKETGNSQQLSSISDMVEFSSDNISDLSPERQSGELFRRPRKSLPAKGTKRIMSAQGRVRSFLTNSQVSQEASQEEEKKSIVSGLSGPSAK